jgi:hypothetical protein
MHKGIKYMPGAEVFEAFPQEVESFLDKLVCLDTHPEEDEQHAGPPRDALRIVETENAGLFDLINTDSGKKINDKPLTVAEVNKVVTESQQREEPLPVRRRRRKPAKEK